jgi:hypothetical protein
MSEETRKPDYPTLNLHPFVGLELGERWGREVGELSQRLTHVEQGVARLEQKTDVLDAKLDRLEIAVIRLGDRGNTLEKRLYSNIRLQWGLFMTLLGAIIVQKLILVNILHK